MSNLALPLRDDVSPQPTLPVRPRYLRVVATTACPLRCSFCHAEGDAHDGGERELPARLLNEILVAAAATGIKKFKFLGGEPLARRDLPDLVRTIRTCCPRADISVISSGVVPPRRFDALFEAGLDRANLSIHGWSVEALGQRGGSERGHALRHRNLTAIIGSGRPTKLNYVYTGSEVREDLASFLDWAALQPVVVNILDDLGDDEASWRTVLDVCRQLRGPWQQCWSEEDPNSLPTTHLVWADGLRVEVKTEQIGLLGPWRGCRLCPARSRCREGIFAVRLNHRGELQPCMDRPDFVLPLLPILRRGGASAVAGAWTDYVDRWLGGRS